MSDERFTTKPPVGATPDSVVVPVDGVPPVTLVGLMETFERAGRLIVRGAVFVTPAAVAVIVAVVTLPTAAVETVNVVEVDPALTVTVDGTVAAVLSDDRVTTKPPVGATLPSVTVPVAEVPPVKVVGLRETL